MKLDVGCGHRPSGDVNTDRYIKATKHRGGENSVDLPLETKAIPNFVQSDACHLPFRDSIFDAVYSHHVIEHIPNPFLMLKEMVRVTRQNGEIRLVCPHKYMRTRQFHSCHVSMLSQNWFERAFRKLGLPKSVIGGQVLRYRNFPHDFFPLFSLPGEIEVFAIKRS